MFVYILQCSDGSTYVGATVDVDKRLRQHNKEIKGGAHATGIKVSKGYSWSRICYVSGFPTWNSALQFEWRLKQLSRKLIKESMNPLERRLYALHELLCMDQSTSNATPFNEWPNKPVVNVEKEIELCSVYLQEDSASSRYLIHAGDAPP